MSGLPGSWVEAAGPESDFGVANLPWGVAETPATPGEASIVVAIGDLALRVGDAVASGLMDGLAPAVRSALRESTLNAFMALGPQAWDAARRAITDLLVDGGSAALRTHARRDALLPARSSLRMRLPADVGDYTDFYASESHATNVGSMFRPDKPLMPNWKHLPVGYHGRASSLVVSGTPVRRPMGQTSATDDGPPTFGACRLLDYELEMGIFIGPGNPLGRRIDASDVHRHLFGMVILNDWSARDVQKWEYQPLGPFNAKNFASTISPWVVTFQALEPYMREPAARPSGDPEPLPYLRVPKDFLVDATLEVELVAPGGGTVAERTTSVSRGSMLDLYWTPAQMVVHHASTGCNLRPGDLLGTGTISGKAPESRGCLLERTWRGTQPLALHGGGERRFLQDGDEVVMRAWCAAPGRPRIGFGECRGAILPAE